MDNEKMIRKEKIKKTAVVLLPIVLAVVATVSVAIMMSGGNTALPEPQVGREESSTPIEHPVGGEPETEAQGFSDSLSIRVGADGRATVVGLGSCADKIVRIPEKTADGVPVTAIGDSAFAYASGIDEVIVPSSVISIGAYAFRGSSISTVTLGSSIISVGNGAFADCRKLEAINVDGANPMYASRDGVLFDREMTLLLCYPSGRRDSSYTIPKSVTEIGNLAFTQCDALVKIRYGGSAKEWSRVHIGSGNSLFDRLTVETDRTDK